mgnify:CR=1 FL=1
MSAQPVVNGKVFSHASITVNVDGDDFFGVSSINYGSELDTSPVHGTGKQQVGVVQGQLKHTGDFEMPTLHGQRLRDKLGPGFMERLITVVVTYRETSISELLTDTVSAYVKKIDKGSQSGADPVKDKFELHVNSVLYNGLSPVAEEG